MEKHELESDIWSEWLLQDRSPHPWAPSLKRILAERFSADERQFFVQMVRPTVESGKNVATDRTVYLQAQRPLS
jgi:arsenite methyltransferase